MKYVNVTRSFTFLDVIDQRRHLEASARASRVWRRIGEMIEKYKAAHFIIIRKSNSLQYYEKHVEVGQLSVLLVSRVLCAETG